MKKLLLHTLLLVVASIPCFLTASAQIMPPVQDYVYVYPNNPTPTDSVTVAYVYVSGDACPDYYLAKDSTVANRIYISKKNIERPATSICATVLTKFSTTINLSTLPENTQIYFERALIKTIQYPCVLDRKGTVVAGSGDCSGQLYIQETTVYLSAIPRLWALPKTTAIDPSGKILSGLKPGDNVKFGGTEIKNDSNTTSPCRITGVVICYEVIPIPPVGCVKDKKGIVVSGEKECAGQLFIQEYSPISSARQLYVIQSIDYTNSNGTTVLKVGDQVLFGGYALKNDSSSTLGCRTVGVATCYEIISTPPACIMDKMGIVTEFKDNSTLVKDSLTGEIYAINNVKLAIGTQLKFKGTKIQCFTTPCYNIVDCYQVIYVPSCIMDKTGVVIAGIDGCTGRLFIQDTSSATTYSRIYAINEVVPVNSSGATGIKPGDKVKFGGYLIKNDSNMISRCHIDGIATCYELLTTPPPCVMDKKGVVVAGNDGCAGQLFIQEYSPINSYPQLYIIKGVDPINNAGTFTTVLKEGDIVAFGGYRTPNDSTISLCHTVGVATCYQVISTPPACVMDKIGIVTEFKDNSTLVKDSLTSDIYAINNIKLAAGTIIKFKGTKIECIKAPCYNIIDCYVVLSTPPSACVKDKEGMVVAGTSGCTGQLFIEEITPYMSPIRRLYSIKDLIVPNSTTPIQTGLKVGDKVKFGGYLTLNDSSKVSLCYTIGVATCYEVIATPPPVCVMDKTGIVVPGIDGCTGKLFIQDTTTQNTIPQLYAFDNIATTTNTKQIGLKAGDKVRFGGNLIKNDSTSSILCPIAGRAICYELVSPDNIYTLSGSVYAGSTLMTSGLAILYRKGDFKATASYTITNGTFTFTNLPIGEYTVYVIPSINLYKNYLPTFYISNYLFKNADYLTVNSSVTDMTVNLKPYEYPTGTGKITGNIFFETYTLKDSLMVDNATLKMGNVPVNNSAMNTPVILLNKLNIPVAWTLTDMVGNYTFENIALDTYRIHTETASARGESVVNLSASNTTANADVLLKSSLTDIAIPNTEDIGLTIYPNPVTDNLIVVLKVSDRIDIYNSMGQLILRKDLNQGINIIDVSTMSKGIYVARIGKSTLKVTKK
ncbi:MAG: T9SS type A sorting domain-containing protein [Paludibacter sp.]|nr:T9SS type A sorting domain-containing protein [Paludibacter sp.]